MEGRKGIDSFYAQRIKAVLDFLLTVVLLLILLPLILLVTIFLYVSNEGKVLFIQTRIGKGEKPFRIYKFKTMRDSIDTYGNLLPDKKRQSKAGNVLRYTHLDELPQLWNVLKGDIAMVGPRPLLPEYLPHYSSRQKMRHLVKPGISGLAQIKGGNALTWERRLELDVQYVEKISAGLDALILWKTFLYLFKKRKPELHLFSESFIRDNRRKEQ